MKCTAQDTVNVLRCQLDHKMEDLLDMQEQIKEKDAIAEKCKIESQDQGLSTGNF